MNLFIFAKGDLQGRKQTNEVDHLKGAGENPKEKMERKRHSEFDLWNYANILYIQKVKSIRMGKN